MHNSIDNLELKQEIDTLTRKIEYLTSNLLMKDKNIENLTDQFKALLTDKNTVEKDNLNLSLTIEELQSQIDKNTDIQSKLSMITESRKKTEEDHQILVQHLDSIKQQ